MIKCKHTTTPSRPCLDCIRKATDESEKAPEEKTDVCEEERHPDIKCHWCGDRSAGFYHVRCAIEMSNKNIREHKRLSAMPTGYLQSEASDRG